jgi:glucuronate isomerase
MRFRQAIARTSVCLLSRFVGLLTDSRSLVSHTRHEYSRRTRCGLLGAPMKHGEIPADRELVVGMVKNICFANARDDFRLELDASYAKESDAGPGSPPCNSGVQR